MTLSFGNVIFYLYLCHMKNNKPSLNYQLGMYVGNYIVLTGLPTLSTDGLKSNTVIEVSAEETAEWAELEKKCFEKMQTEEFSKHFYENRKWYHKLEEKYLPETVELMVPRVVPTNMEQFTEGIKAVLWDCDLSHYKIEEGFFVKTDKHAWCSIIILTRHIEKVPEKFA